MNTEAVNSALCAIFRPVDPPQLNKRMPWPEPELQNEILEPWHNLTSSWPEVERQMEQLYGLPLNDATDKRIKGRYRQSVFARTRLHSGTKKGGKHPWYPHNYPSNIMVI